MRVDLGDWEFMLYLARLEAGVRRRKMFVYGVRVHGRWVYGVSPIKPVSIRRVNE